MPLERILRIYIVQNTSSISGNITTRKHMESVHPALSGTASRNPATNVQCEYVLR